MRGSFEEFDNYAEPTAAATAPAPLTCSEFARLMLGFEPDEKQCQILDSETLQGILNCCRQFGKSTVMAAKAVYQAWVHDNCTVIIASPGQRQSRIMMRMCKDFYRILGLKPHGDGDNAISLLFPNGSRIVGLPGRPDTVRGFSAVLVLVDEAAYVSDAMFNALGPMMAATNGAMWLLSTPNGAQGFFHKVWKDGGAGWERYEAPATECARIRPEFLARERRLRGDRQYAQEYGCEFVDNGQTYFSRDVVMAAFDPNEKPFTGL